MKTIRNNFIFSYRIQPFSSLCIYGIRKVLVVRHRLCWSANSKWGNDTIISWWCITSPHASPGLVGCVHGMSGLPNAATSVQYVTLSLAKHFSSLLKPCHKFHCVSFQFSISLHVIFYSVCNCSHVVVILFFPLYVVIFSFNFIPSLPSPQAVNRSPR